MNRLHLEVPGDAAVAPGAGERGPCDKRLELYGAQSTKPGLKRFLRLTTDAKLRV